MDAYPREKPVRKFRDGARLRTRRRVPLKATESIKEINPVLRGWGLHFFRAHVRLLSNRLDRWIVRRIWSHQFRHWMNCGWKTLPNSRLYGEYGLVNLVSLMPLMASQKKMSS